MTQLLELYGTQIVALAQASFCGGIAFMIAFKYRRGSSTYDWLISLCAFGLASVAGQQWLSITGRILMYGEWPVVSTQNTIFFAIFFVLITRAKGNVARMFEGRRV